MNRSKLPNLTETNQCLINDNHKVFIFHLSNYISPFVPKPHAEMSKKLALLLSCFMTVSPMILS